MQRKIIIGFERTPQGDDALALGAELGDALEAVILVATVMPWTSSAVAGQELERALEADSREAFAIARDRLRPREVETRAVADPSPAAGLYRLAEAEYATLIVVGSSNRGPVGRVLPGSVAESLLHGAACAVAVAPRGFAESPDRHLRRIAVAFDGSPEAWAALETAIGIANRTHGTLGVLTVSEPPALGSPSSVAVLNPAELGDVERREKERVLKLALQRVPPALHAEGRVLTGEPGPALAAAARDFDLIVTGSRGYGPLRRAILGSTSEKLIRAAPCPVLVPPRGAGVDPLGVGSRPSLTAIG